MSGPDYTIKQLCDIIIEEMGFAPDLPVNLVLSESAKSLGLTDECNGYAIIKDKAKFIARALGRL
jgi:hypothetical protein